MTVYRFFPLPTVKEFSKPRECNENLLLIGDTATCKSSLLFQAALTFALDGEQVMYICPEPLTEKPLTVHGMLSPNPVVCQHIKMIYINNGQELIDYLATFHKSTSLPIAILIDDLSFYVHQLTLENDVEHIFAKLSALLLDTMGFLTKKKGQSCHLLTTLTDTKQWRTLLPICKRYFKEVWIASVDNVEDIPSSKRFHMTDTSSSPIRIYYHVNKEMIYLDKITRLTNSVGFGVSSSSADNCR